jgi:penicillin-insensitive murein DD-endopeptidase
MRRLVGAALCVLLVSNQAFAQSQCYGTTSNGRIENSVALPKSGANFQTYSAAGVTLGRTYVHTRVQKILLDAYRALETTAPNRMFVYGETGWQSGGRFRPHRTHQNGLSVDFFVPVIDAAGKSVPLPTPVSKKFGYDIEFDTNGKYDQYTIDFEAMAEHLVQLHIAAKREGAPISLLIFDPPLMPKLLATKRGEYLKQHMPFMKGKAWVRHDEHYHVDFAIPCKPMR